MAKIKNFIARAKIKGKTRGRPSNFELFFSKTMSYWLNENKDEIEKMVEDSWNYGSCYYYIDEKTLKIERIFPLLERNERRNRK